MPELTPAEKVAQWCERLPRCSKGHQAALEQVNRAGGTAERVTCLWCLEGRA